MDCPNTCNYLNVVHCSTRIPLASWRWQAALKPGLGTYLSALLTALPILSLVQKLIRTYSNCRAASVASEVRPIIAVYSRFCDICICICLSAHALHKTIHILCKSMQASYHVGSLCIVLRNTACSLEHHFEESTTLRSCPFARYGQRRQLS